MGKNYLISNPLMYKILDKKHPEEKKITDLKIYASNMVEKIPKDELKKILNESGLILNT